MTTAPGSRSPARPRCRAVTPAALAVVAVLLLAGCAADANSAAAAAADAAGFWPGLWHGLISPITFIVSLFSDTVGIYQVRNSGGWYDVGFMLGVSIVFGGNGGRRHAGRLRRRASVEG